MGAFNILKAKIVCSGCGKSYEGRVQFKFGDTWQLEYIIGDQLKWVGNDKGKPGLAKVKVYGVLESKSDVCPNCGKTIVKDEYDIYIEKDTIVEIRELENSGDYSQHDGDYKIL